jgi:hypothetical protein
LKIPNGKSETAYRRTNSTSTKQKAQHIKQ